MKSSVDVSIFKIAKHCFTIFIHGESKLTLEKQCQFLPTGEKTDIVETTSCSYMHYSCNSAACSDHWREINTVIEGLPVAVGSTYVDMPKYYVEGIKVEEDWLIYSHLNYTC